MVRSYQRKKSSKYSKEELLAAVEAVKSRGMKVTQAARRFGVPFSTLYDHTKGKVSSGSPTILTVMEEKELASVTRNWIWGHEGAGRCGYSSAILS